MQGRPEKAEDANCLVHSQWPSRFAGRFPTLSCRNTPWSYRTELNVRRSLRRQLLQLIKNRARLVAPSALLQITSDAADNILVECADAARADYLVTGNRALPQVLEKHQDHHVKRISWCHRPPPYRLNDYCSHADGGWEQGLISGIDKLHFRRPMKPSAPNRKSQGLICSMHRGAMPRTL